MVGRQLRSSGAFLMIYGGHLGWLAMETDLAMMVTDIVTL